MLGIDSVVGPGGFDEAVLTQEFPLMIGLAVALYLMSRSLRKSGYGSIERWAGGMMVAVFVAYQAWIFLTLRQ